VPFVFAIMTNIPVFHKIDALAKITGKKLPVSSIRVKNSVPSHN
jgi:hypothetical protein